MQQPPLSQRIKAIETESMSSCFGARRGGVELTEAGRVFLDRARAPLRNIDGAFEATRSAARASRAASAWRRADHPRFIPSCPGAIRAFRAAFPLVSLTLDECLGKEALERLRDEQMDVAFLRALRRTAEPRRQSVAGRTMVSRAERSRAGAERCAGGLFH